MRFLLESICLPQVFSGLGDPVHGGDAGYEGKLFAQGGRIRFLQAHLHDEFLMCFVKAGGAETEILRMHREDLAEHPRIDGIGAAPYDIEILRPHGRKERGAGDEDPDKERRHDGEPEILRTDAEPLRDRGCP